MNQLAPAEFASRIRRIESEEERTNLLLLLRQDRKYGRATLEALAKDRDPEIRHWVTEAAGQVLGHEAVPLLAKLSRDRDLDTRIDALNILVQIDPAEAMRMRDTLRRRARSKDIYEAQGALWALGAIRDVEALDVIRAAKDRDNAIPRNTAIVVELLLTAPDEICKRIEQHDHDLMAWLTKAAQMLGTERARRALEHCAAEAPDDECKFWASEELARLGACEDTSPHSPP